MVCGAQEGEALNHSPALPYAVLMVFKLVLVLSGLYEFMLRCTIGEKRSNSESHVLRIIYMKICDFGCSSVLRSVFSSFEVVTFIRKEFQC